MGPSKSTRSSIAKDPNAANEANCGLPMTLSPKANMAGMIIAVARKASVPSAAAEHEDDHRNASHAQPHAEDQERRPSLSILPVSTSNFCPQKPARKEMGRKMVATSASRRLTTARPPAER